ncbi:DUF3991 and toprim domain-containing protein [Lactococcus lactis]|uniref:DUF3991 domain-containing protein n=1 Tax=Lactococcus lactis TaxID=1358 RepID=A0AAW5TGF2_9LACT|nr:DUF3991 and toprim domain-containing protein [Lactococcus lactis]MCW2280150.1 hypothetical protein [Lactococcus lactis]
MATYQELVELAHRKNILEVAAELGMKLDSDYRWIVPGEKPKGLTFKPEYNIFSWWSHGIEGKDPIALVMLMKDCSRKEAIKFLVKGEAQVFTSPPERKKEPFKYYLREAKTFDYAKRFLRDTRGLSEETIEIFHSRGLIVQGVYHPRKTPIGTTEPVVGFKNYDLAGNIVGASVKGIWHNPERYPDSNGRVKEILKGSDGYSGFNVRSKLSKEKSPLHVYAFEANLDLMSYFELHREKFKSGNFLLISMEGRKEKVLSKAILMAFSRTQDVFEKSKKPETFLEFINRSTNGFPKEELEIHLCVDNDAAGRDFVQSITNKYGAKFSITEDLPPLHPGQTKNDWNDELKYSKGMLELPKTQKISPRKSLKINH